MSSAAIADEAYVPVAVSTLVPETLCPCSLYLREGTHYRLYRDANFPFESSDRDRLLERGLSRLFIAVADARCYNRYLRERLGQVLHDESLPIRERFHGLNEVARTVLQDAYVTRDTNQIADTAQELAGGMVGTICDSDLVAADILQVMCHDYHTFTHSVNVAYLTLLLASRLGVSRDELLAIAVGALLHDLGKLHIPERILGKNGRLDISELAVMQRHPTIGFEALSQRSDLSWGQLMMVYQHHEKWSGGGYPVGSVGEEIHPWARLCSVADVFEALTANRPYRRAFSLSDALELMHLKISDNFEPCLLQCFQSIIRPS